MPSDTARIAKNTLALYFRQILIMLVSLYTVRVVLEVLGVEDYGIYNIVAGVVVLFSFLNGAMANAIQRFLNYTLGQDNIEQARDFYSQSFIVQALMAILVVIIAETIGVWFFYNWLNIPASRQSAAFIVYQFSIVATVVNILRVPYEATIIAYEKMSFFARVSIVESILKLATVFLLVVISVDSLMLYAFLICVVGVIIFFVYKLYCNKNFEIAIFRYRKDKNLFRQLISFSGWSVFGKAANTARSQGITILINIFHGVTVNAALGIAMQVNSAIYQFVSNFQIASRPQIIKLYANKDYHQSEKLVFQTCKFSIFLLFIFVLPLYINADFVLHLWLKNVPVYTIAFTRLILLFSLIECICGPLWTSIQATGNIKKYSIIASSITSANLPVSFLFLFLGFDPVWVLIVKIILNAIVFIWSLFFLKNIGHISIRIFLHDVIIPVFIIIVVSSSINIAVSNIFIDWTRLLLSCGISVLCIGFLVYSIGLSKHEKVFLKNLIRKRLAKQF